METSRMFQYGLLFDWNPDLFKELSAGIDTTPGGWRVKIRLTVRTSQRHEQHPQHGR